MLKVNTDKISLPEFAKKYGMRMEGSSVVHLVRVARNGCPRIIGRGVDGGMDILNCDYDTLFDMIMNGDVTKEESK